MPDDLQRELKEVCIAVTHAARDPRLTRAEMFEYVKLLNSAAQIGLGLSQRIEKKGLEVAKGDIFRFVGVAMKRTLAVRQAVEERESDPLEDAWDIEDVE